MDNLSSRNIKINAKTKIPFIGFVNCLIKINQLLLPINLEEFYIV